jgi:dihydroorotate dehydrogenase
MSLILRGIDFGPVQGASGVQGFFSGWEYPYRWFLTPLLWIFGYRFKGMTFVSKTSTYEKRAGNARVRKDGITFRDLNPDCIKVYLSKQSVFNSVGLTGPGLESLLRRERWARHKKPFMISIMSIEKTADARLDEHLQMYYLLRSYKRTLPIDFGIQLNISCPNTGHNMDDYWEEVFSILDVYQDLNRPIVVKINALMSVEYACKIAEHPACNAIIQGNSLPYREFPHKIYWELFGEESPIFKANKSFGKGGLSGKFLYPIMRDWIRQAEAAGISVPIVACGGIMERKQIRELAQFKCVKAVALGSVAILKPWRVAGLIKEAQKCFANKKYSVKFY